MPSATRPEVDRFHTLLQTDPEIAPLNAQLRALLQQYPAGKAPPAMVQQQQALAGQIKALVAQRGVQWPHDWQYHGAQDTITKDSFLTRNTWIPAVAAAGLGAYGMGAFGGAGAKTAAGAAGTKAGVDAVTGQDDVAPDFGGSGGSNMADIIKRLAQAGLPIGALLGTRALTGGGGDGQNGQSPVSPELQQLLAMSMKRMASQEPLFDAVNKQAFEGLPDYVKRGQ